MPYLVAVKPTVQWDAKSFKTGLQKGLRNTADYMKREYEKTTRTWDRDVKFGTKTDQSGDELKVYVGTDDEIYGYVDRGTEPHLIQAVNAPYLRFQTGFVSKTVPNLISSRKGGKSGPWVRVQSVQHPGNEPRNFTKIIAAAGQKRLQLEVNKALGDWISANITQPTKRGRK